MAAESPSSGSEPHTAFHLRSSIAGYVLYGMFIPSLDSAYMPSWKITVSCDAAYALVRAACLRVIARRSP